MGKNKKAINTSEFLFFLGWFIFAVSYMMLKESELMYIVDTNGVYKLFKILYSSIFALKIAFIDKYNLKTISIYFLVISITFINSLSIHYDIVFSSLLIAFAGRNIDFKKFVKFDLKIRSVMILLIIFLCFLGIFPNFTRMINFSYKQSLGFSHPNILGLNVVTILLEYLYLNKKINFKFLLVNVILLLFLNFICNTRTSIYAYSLILMIYIFTKNSEKIYNNKFVKTILCLLPIITLSFSIILIKGYESRNEIVIKLDEIVTTRIRSAYNFYHKYGINMMGSKLKIISTRQSVMTGEKQKILDMGYLRLIINNGVLTCIIVISILCILQRLIYKKKDFKLLLISTFFIVIGLLETNVYNIAFNFTLIEFVNLINFKKNEIKGK